MKKAKGLWKVLYGRTAIIVVLIALQIALLFGLYLFLENRMIYVNGMMSALSIVAALCLMNNREDSSIKLTWIFTILLAPVFGTLFYIFTRIQPGTKAKTKKIEYISNRQRPLQEQNWKTYENLLEGNKADASFARYMDTKAWAPVYENCNAKYLSIGQEFYEELLVQLNKAEEFIFMEFFILDRGYMWNSILKILKRKVNQGVEVRLMYDGTCSLALLPYEYYKNIQRLGIKCKPFAQIKPFLSTHQNNRDHRKIVVIDGKVGMTGGVNIADEYINRIERFGHWKDVGIMIKGQAVNTMTLMFLQMWDVDSKVLTDYASYLRNYNAPDLEEDPFIHRGGYIIPYGDSPLDNETVGRQVYLDILNRARNYVHIMTPYLILDNGMLDALKYASKRGVEVDIIMPHIPDKQYAYLLARTYYRELIDAGVNIYEYVPGFIHAKVFSCDDERAVVGTINMDYRSLYLHFECAIYAQNNDIINDIESDYTETLKKCIRITSVDCRKFNIGKKLAGSLLRVVAPLM